MHLYYIRCYVRNEYAQNDLYYLSLLFPMISLCSLLGMYMPRSARFMFTVCTTYLMVCLFMVVALMRDLFGSRAALSEFLTAWNQKISFQAPPLCCCCPCLPKIKPTEKGLRRIERLVLQSPVVRITLEILNIVLFLEDAAYDKSKLVLEVLEHISFLVALYGCFILMHLGKEKLRPYQFLPIFLFVNLTQIIITLQREIFIVLGRYILFSTTRQPYTQAYFWNGFITTFEMLLLQCSATYLLSPRRCAIFNTFNRAESLDAIDKVDAQALKETEHEV
ncbi:Organic solute transporter alpha-like protein 1 [Toxocara canis]|uniref:Organic solute transporter alpha-like protein 1 n=1 Tax=Toxocara canis TaxID=6265 RepID=A0A0B2VE93_TOXCA|nr:Organic solute transporter alpha-like protein 1 [Toxocara canis]